MDYDVQVVYDYSMPLPIAIFLYLAVAAAAFTIATVIMSTSSDGPGRRNAARAMLLSPLWPLLLVALIIHLVRTALDTISQKEN